MVPYRKPQKKHAYGLGIADISQIAIDWHRDIGDFVGIVCAFSQLLILAKEQ